MYVCRFELSFSSESITHSGFFLSIFFKVRLFFISTFLQDLCLQRFCEKLKSQKIEIFIRIFFKLKKCYKELTKNCNPFSLPGL